MSKLTKALTAAAGNAGGDNLYVEDVFSTYVYEGSGAARTIANGIPLSDEGGLVWLKQRGAVDSHVLFDTVNGPQKSLASNDTAAGANYSSYLSFPSAGTAGWNLAGAILNGTGTTWASWSFRKAEKFFDVVTYTGDGVAGRTVAHNLGSTPSCIIIKRTDSAKNWTVYHSGLNGGSSPESYSIHLNLSEAQGAYGAAIWNSTAPSGSVFTLGSSDLVNASGGSYVAYVFASDAGGFGDDGDENIIKCGSYTGNGSATGPEINLGFEPQFLIAKRTDGSNIWWLVDDMRGMVNGGDDAVLFPGDNYSESSSNVITPTSTGFQLQDSGARVNASGGNYIYIAIRRPMKTPESGTEVFAPISLGTTTEPGFISNFVTDFTIHRTVDETAGNQVSSRMTGNEYMLANATSAAGTISAVQWDFMNGSRVGNGTANADEIQWMFKRATGFMDVVAYSGNSVSGRTVNHGLKVIPEFIIIKAREASRDWVAYTAPTGAGYYLKLNDTQASAASSGVFPSAPTDSVFSLGSGSFVNSTASGAYIAYLFATLAGVSKVGSYTGNATNTTIDCGFSNGARFVLIKRTDATGDWFVYDSNRGITTGVSPYITLNTTATEVTNAGWLEAASSGFLVNDNASTQLNINNATYIFLAIA